MYIFYIFVEIWLYHLIHILLHLHVDPEHEKLRDWLQQNFNHLKNTVNTDQLTDLAYTKGLLLHDEHEAVELVNTKRKKWSTLYHYMINKEKTTIGQFVDIIKDCYPCFDDRVADYLVYKL